MSSLWLTASSIIQTRWMDLSLSMAMNGSVRSPTLFLENECEIVSLDSARQGMGVGTMLIHNVVEEARKKDCRRIFLITTNDNLNALGFYQKRGFELVAVHRGALEKSRKIKPGIPLMGANNIPLRDEIELEMIL